MKTVRTWLGVVVGLFFAISGVWFLIVDATDIRGWGLLGVALLSGIVLWGFRADKDPDQSRRL
ncbi:hypothetical protein JOE59_000220 [Agromyces cerinus]|uniref:hypothetical protein n=1 Tax=Agromyces cerinus TaxID=33878 RepID=UPI00195B57DC|nr:hypothetical protein [Agromyces cerinus]MBM7829515.1 hypothetical protein [Agromyces cerinus]